MSQKSSNQSHEETKNKSYEIDKLDIAKEQSTTQKMLQIFSSPKEYNYDSDDDFMAKRAVEETTSGASAAVVGGAMMPLPPIMLKNMN